MKLEKSNQKTSLLDNLDKSYMEGRTIGDIPNTNKNGEGGNALEEHVAYN